MARQLLSAIVWSALIGALAGALMCVIAFGENLSMHVVDESGAVDLGFLAMLFLRWSAPIAAGAFVFILAGALVVNAVRWAAERAPRPGP
jgi:hypothetical protein